MSPKQGNLPFEESERKEVLHSSLRVRFDRDVERLQIPQPPKGHGTSATTCKNVLNFLNKKIGTHSACRLLTSTIRQACGIKAAGTLTQAVKWLAECGFVSWTRTGRSSAYQINRENIQQAVRQAEIETGSLAASRPESITRSPSEFVPSDILNVTGSLSECDSARVLHTTSLSNYTAFPTWDLAAAAVEACGVERFRPFVNEAQRRGKTPAEVIEATQTFLANRIKFNGPQALFGWLRDSCWPVSGIRDAKTIADERQRNRELQQRLAMQTDVERGPLPEWDDELRRIDQEGGSKAVLKELQRRQLKPTEAAR